VAVPARPKVERARSTGATPDLLAVRPGFRPRRPRSSVLAVLALHVVATWGLLQLDGVRQVLKAMPAYMLWATADTPPQPQPPVPLPAPPVVQPPAAMTLPLPPVPPPDAITVQAAPAPADPGPAPTPAPAPAAVAATATPALVPPLAPAQPPPAPKLIPASALQFIEAPAPAYPRLSRRNGETGMVIVRALVGAAGGPPLQALIQQSSGHARLDEAALLAVQKSRFKPYLENGRPVEAWASVPLNFELEK
jgi:protein TonB